ncbi:MAG TPA: PQQ-binding-like beta-propeller repeat protein [Exilispira sp.]|nr:PQQ-binding-like beta-propeller repeat protein [Exilispira sp.]
MAYFPTDDGMLFAFDRKTGKELWRIKLAKRFMASPIISNEVIYIAGSD